ncbi:hypothetical protein D9M72_484380 [compost metagenome]
MGDPAQLGLPVRVRREDRQLVEDKFGDPVQEVGAVGRVAVEAHGIPVQGLSQPAHAQGFEPLGVHQFEGSLKH